MVSFLAFTAIFLWSSQLVAANGYFYLGEGFHPSHDDCPFLTYCPPLPYGLRCVNDYDYRIYCSADEAPENTSITMASPGKDYRASCVLTKATDGSMSCTMQFPQRRIFNHKQRWTVDTIRDNVVQATVDNYNPACYTRLNPPPTPRPCELTVTIGTLAHHAVSHFKIEVEWSTELPHPGDTVIVANTKQVMCTRGALCKTTIWDLHPRKAYRVRTRMIPWDNPSTLVDPGVFTQKFWSNWSAYATWIPRTTRCGRRSN